MVFILETSQFLENRTWAGSFYMREFVYEESGIVEFREDFRVKVTETMFCAFC